MSPEEKRRERDAVQRARNRQYGAPPNVAWSWDAAEAERLRGEIAEGLEAGEIARRHGRLEMGIVERKAALGLYAPAVLAPPAVRRPRRERAEAEVPRAVEAVPIVAPPAEVPGAGNGSEGPKADAAEQGALFEFQGLNPYEGKPLSSR